MYDWSLLFFVPIVLSSLGVAASRFLIYFMTRSMRRHSPAIDSYFKRISFESRLIAGRPLPRLMPFLLAIAHGCRSGHRVFRRYQNIVAFVVSFLSSNILILICLLFPAFCLAVFFILNRLTSCVNNVFAMVVLASATIALSFWVIVSVWRRLNRYLRLVNSTWLLGRMFLILITLYFLVSLLAVCYADIAIWQNIR